MSQLPLRWTTIVLGLVLVVSAGASESYSQEPKAGEQVDCVFKYKVDGKEKELKYDLFVPANYDDKKELPLMLFLHGAGERGSELAKVRAWGPPKIVKKKKDFPFIVISPQCPSGAFWPQFDDVLAKLVDEVAGELKVNKSKMYCTGLSMGGFGTWSLCAKHPKLFAAAAPICGGGKPSSALDLKDLPIWAFHGDADKVVPYSYSEKLVNAIKEAGGKQIKFTTYKGVGHNSWSQAYATQELYDWMLSHSRKK